MKTLTLGLSVVGAAGAAALFLATPAQSQFAGSFVALQASYPGTAQSGIVNVTNSANCVISASNSTTANGAAAVCGTATSTTGITIGVYGNCFSDSGRGVFGACRSTTGVGLGVYGYTDADSGSGVYGYAFNSAGVNYGVYGKTNSSAGYGGYFMGRGYFSGNVGIATSTPAYPLEVLGSAGYVVHAVNSIASNGSAAVFGDATASSSVNIGVYGNCASDTGRGVFGAARAATGAAIGVYGYSATGGASYGLYSSGNSGASGTKSFRIDHPLDPTNKYLLHYSSESPEPENFYNGIVTTDASGSAWVNLPDYFAEINKDYRYSLTVVDDTDGEEFVQAKVAREIEGNRFKIRTSAPNVKVSWEVKALRNDRWVQTYGAPTEIDKEGREIGRYQRPELYGKPAEMGVDYFREQAGTKAKRGK